MASSKLVHVAVGVIVRNTSKGRQEILLSKRHKDAHQGGLWEFPGGKVEPGESLPVALARELAEELGIVLDSSDSDASRPLIQISHDYGDKRVLLDVWLVTKFTKAPDDGIGLEGQRVQWVERERLREFSFPEANVPIISACLLPEHYLITPIYTSVDSARVGITELCSKTSGMILLRQPQLRQNEYFEWLDELLIHMPGIEQRLILSANFSGIDFASECFEVLLERFREYKGRIKGVHFPSKAFGMLAGELNDLGMLLGVSCHSEEELASAQRIGADFAVLSPVRETSSHPDALPIGWSQFNEWVKLATIPVYALGGMREIDLEDSFRAGAQGIAGISAWSNQQ